jgi:hypothetical protein
LETDKRRPISQPNFSKKIEQVFYKVYKEPLSVRFLRMSWISALMKTNPIKEEMKELAKLMSHSKDEQSRYNMILKWFFVLPLKINGCVYNLTYK